MKFKNKLLFTIWTFLVLIVPINALAYSEYIIPGGDNVGIEVNSSGVLVVGFYKVNDEYIAKDSGFMIGDKIIKVNDTKISSINEMVDVINKSETDNIVYKVERDNKEKSISLNRTSSSDGVYKTGIYVKDSILGIGTLTFVDPNTKKFGALGHEILEKTTAKKFEIKDGKIFKSDVIGVERSENGSAGEKNANYDKNKVYGNIKENTPSGIFGDYTDALPDVKKLKVASKDEVKIGPATIRTVINNNEIKEYNINIIK